MNAVKLSFRSAVCAVRIYNSEAWCVYPRSEIIIPAKKSIHISFQVKMHNKIDTSYNVLFQSLMDNEDVYAENEWLYVKDYNKHEYIQLMLKNKSDNDMALSAMNRLYLCKIIHNNRYLMPGVDAVIQN
jgi:hypothetical protein